MRIDDLGETTSKELPAAKSSGLPLVRRLPERRTSYLAVSEAAFNWAMGRKGTIALASLAVFACLFFLQWARALLVPITCGVILALLCNPIVRSMQRLGVPRALSSGAVLLALWGGGVVVAYSVQASVINLLDTVPAGVERVVNRVEHLSAGGWPAWRSVSEAAAALERATSAVTTGDARPRAPMRVQIESSAENLRTLLVSSSAGLLGLAAEFMVVSFLTYFLLTAGPNIKRKFIRAYGHTLGEKKQAINMVNDLAARIQSTLLALSVSNILHGFITGSVFHMLGVGNAFMWGIAIAVAHFIPYFGAGIIALASLVAGIVQFPSLAQACMPAIASLIIATLIGNLLTVWLQSRTTRMDSLSIFIGMLIWGWLWGPIGFLIGAPLMAMFKSVCDHVPALRTVAELMEAAPPKKTRRSRFWRRARQLLWGSDTWHAAHLPHPFSRKASHSP